MTSDEIKISDYNAGRFSAPILYIRDNKIYTPDNYGTGFLGGDPNGYIEKNESVNSGYKSTNSNDSKSTGDTSPSGGTPAFSGVGCVGLIIAFLLVGGAVSNLAKNNPVLLVSILTFFALAFLGRIFFNKNRRCLLKTLSEHYFIINNIKGEALASPFSCNSTDFSCVYTGEEPAQNPVLHKEVPK